MHRLHRNSQKRFYDEGAVYFITTVTHERYPYFREPILAELFILNLWFAKNLKQFALYGYTVLPNHVHLLVQPSEKANYSEAMGSLKRNTARDINDILVGKSLIRTIAGGDSNPRLRSLDVLRANYEITKRDHPHLHFDTYATHFRGIEKLRKQFVRKHGKNHSFPRFRWQPSFRDHMIRDERDYLHHLEYIHGNALKHGLVNNPEDYLYMWVEGMLERIFP